MNLKLLIDSIVRQTTVLIAQLATAQGVRAPLAHVANQVFLDLAQELNRQGVSRKVSADMFGLALRTYLRKLQRLEEGATDRGHSLWEAVLRHLQAKGGSVLLRNEVLQRFHRDDPELVRGVLHDLCDSGLVFRIGQGDGTAYRAATEDELGTLSGAAGSGEELLWAIIYREGPIGLDALRRLVPGPGLDTSLQRLLEGGRIAREDAEDGPRFSASQFFVARGAPSGWEAAIFDHFQAGAHHHRAAARRAIGGRDRRRQHLQLRRLARPPARSGGARSAASFPRKRIRSQATDRGLQPPAPATSIASGHHALRGAVRHGRNER